MDQLNVTAVIVTRGDVDLDPIYQSLPDDWEVLVWDNSGEMTVGWPELRAYRPVAVWPEGSIIDLEAQPAENLLVFGRYAAIKHATHDLIYVQDDDVIVSDPQTIVDEAWLYPNVAVCNMPSEFRPHYDGHALVGFGACFHRDLPQKAFDRFFHLGGFGLNLSDNFFLRTCDIVFTGLTERALVDVPIRHLPYAHAGNRMWKQPEHTSERAKMLRLVEQAR